jgi:hypothetical protein
MDVAFHRVKGEIVFAEFKMGGVGFDEVVDSVGDFFLEPHAVKAPVGSEFEHGSSFRHELEDFLENAFFLGLVDTFVFFELEGDFVAVIRAGNNANAVVHDLLVSVDLACVINSGDVFVVGTGKGILYAEFPVGFFFLLFNLSFPGLFDLRADDGDLFENFADGFGEAHGWGFFRRPFRTYVFVNGVPRVETPGYCPTNLQFA